MLAVEPTARAACVFVHGWGGDAINTWTGFPTMIRESGRAEGVDFYFFGYDSLTATSTFSAALLRQFLKELLDNPLPTLINPALADHRTGSRDATFRYDRLIVCAHSLGAVVTRRALLDLESGAKGRFCRLNLRVLLFAPAHKGTDLVSLGRDLASGSFLGIPIGAIAQVIERTKLRSLADLETGSPALEALERANREARESLKTNGLSDDCFRARVLHAQHDSVVRQDPFDADYPVDPVLKHTHTSICKPSDTFRLPVERLEELL